jgi:hypothetical protein
MKVDSTKRKGQRIAPALRHSVLLNRAITRF